MPIRWSIEGRILLFAAEGEYELDDVRAALDAAIAAPEFEAPMCMLADARASEANPSVDQIQQTASYLATIRESFLPVWVLVVRGSLRYGLARMLSVFAGEFGIQLAVHRDLDEGWREARRAAA